MKLLYRISFWLICLSVLVLSLLPVQHLPPMTLNWWDKAQHAFAFFVLGVVGLLAYAHRTREVIGGLVFLGISIEVLQAITGWRYGDYADVMADLVGIAIAWAVWVGFLRLSANYFAHKK